MLHTRSNAHVNLISIWGLPLREGSGIVLGVLCHVDRPGGAQQAWNAHPILIQVLGFRLALDRVVVDGRAKTTSSGAQVVGSGFQYERACLRLAMKESDR
jgi:hypothetical protein